MLRALCHVQLRRTSFASNFSKLCCSQAGPGERVPVLRQPTPESALSCLRKHSSFPDRTVCSFSLRLSAKRGLLVLAVSELDPGRSRVFLNSPCYRCARKVTMLSPVEGPEFAKFILRVTLESPEPATPVMAPPSSGSMLPPEPDTRVVEFWKRMRPGRPGNGETKLETKSQNERRSPCRLASLPSCADSNCFRRALSSKTL